MSVNLIPLSTAAAASANITVVEGTSVGVFLFGEHTGSATINLVSSANTLVPIGDLTKDNDAAVLAQPGIYRITKQAGPNCGVDRMAA